MSFQPYPGFAALVGKTLTKIDGGKDSDMLTFHTTEGETYKMYHSQSCCETVYLEDVAGELSDLIGSPIIRAEENSNDDPDLGRMPGTSSYDSYTWTFYRIQTKGLVVLRWYGTSNGYYSETATFKRIS
jgi:hypothetical protein